MSDYPDEVRAVVSASSELTSNVRVTVVGHNEYQVFARDEMLFLNPNKQIYGIKDETKQDGFLYCNDFAEAIGTFTSKLINES